MKPDKQDVLQLVIALFTLISSLERAKATINNNRYFGLVADYRLPTWVNPSEIAAELDLKSIIHNPQGPNS